MKNMNLTPFEDVLDEFYGPVGTPERDEHDAKVAAALQAYQIGNAIKEARKKQGLTQAQLGERIGVQKSQVSKIESGKGVSFASLIRVFQALGAKTASIDFGNLGRIALW